MKTRFPHLTNATEFPGNTGNVFGQYPNDFDYNRWDVGTKIILARVPWDIDRNVVDWTDHEEIVSYFENLDSSSSFTLESEMNREPDGAIRLPVPISNLKTFNYCFVQFKTPTSETQPLDYAGGQRQPFIGYFMRDFRFVAPSTTEAQLDVDYWTTCINDLQVQNLMLERGHAPMAAVDVDTYLSDPIHNNRYLLTSDVSFGEPSITTAAQFESWMATTEPLMVLAVSSTLQQVQAMLAKKDLGGKNTNPTFSNDPARWGREYKVSGYSWAGVSPYKDSQVQSTTWSTSTGLPTGVTMIAVKVKSAKTFLDYCQANSPEIFSVVQTCFLIPGSLVASTEAGTYGGVQLYELKPLEQLPPVPVTLEKEDFGYPEEFNRIAKLYTFPYAGLTFSDNAGHSVDVKIEYTSSVQIHRRVSLAYPYLRAQAFLSGVNGSGNTSYEWVDASGVKKTGSMPQAEWTETLLEYDVPTYALTQTAVSQYLLQNSTTAEIERANALQSYHNGTRSLNQSTENSKDSADAAHTNAIRSNDTNKANSERSNNTSLANTLASNATSNANALASNATSYNNSVASANTALGNANRSADASRQAITNSNTASTEKLGYRNENADEIYTINNTQAQSTNNQSISYRKKAVGELVPSQTLLDKGRPFTYEETVDPGPWWTNLVGIPSGTFDTATWKVAGIDGEKMRWIVDHMNVNNKLFSMTLNNNWFTSQMAQWDSSTNTAMGIGESMSTVAGGLMGGAQGGGAVDAATSVVSSSQSIAQNKLSKEQAEAQWVYNANNVFYDLAQNFANMEMQNDYSENLYEINRTAMEASKNQGKTLDGKNTNRDISLASTNGDLSQTTAKTNAQDSNTTALANALASKDTADSNSNASKATGDSNATASHDATATNIEKTWDATRLNADLTQKTSKENSVFSQDSGLLNAQANLRLAQENWQKAAENHKTDSPLTRGSFTGDPTPELWGQRGVEIRVKTQPLGAIASAGSEMLRYGYRLDQSWVWTGWSVMKHFSYWKCSDVWLTPSSAFAELGKATVRGIIESGVTVWRKPEEIGTVPVTENWEED